MNYKKRIIFHLPINPCWVSGSSIRPVQMIKAFENIGYEVDSVIGDGKERKVQINKIKQSIKDGIRYEFMYSESTTIPTLLTETHHLPLYPILDFGFMRFCKNHNIKIGLFYRDIFWMFEDLLELPRWKFVIIKLFGKYDLLKYNELVDILYLPSKKMLQYIPINFKGQVRELFPGSNIVIERSNKSNKNLRLFYVGGIGSHYNMKKLVKVVSEFSNILLTICCRKHEWDKIKDNYEPLMSHNIKIIHKQGEYLHNYYMESDIACIFVEPILYRSFAMPVKLFEYMGNRAPILASTGTAVADFIEKNDVGWAIDYSEKDLREFLEYISDNREELINKIHNINNIIKKHTWESRSFQVEKEFQDL